MFNRIKYLRRIAQLEAEIKVLKELPLIQIAEALKRIEKRNSK